MIFSVGLEEEGKDNVIEGWREEWGMRRFKSEFEWCGEVLKLYIIGALQLELGLLKFLQQ